MNDTFHFSDSFRKLPPGRFYILDFLNFLICENTSFSVVFTKGTHTNDFGQKWYKNEFLNKKHLSVGVTEI